MKKILTILLLLLLLTGCNALNPQSTEPEANSTELHTEPTVSWIEAYAVPWDREGVLTELPLNIPDGMHYGMMQEFDGDLLLWGVDDHLIDNCIFELCILDLDSGEVIARKDFPLSEYTNPQILGNTLYLTEPTAGRVHALDKNLNILNTWNVDPMPGAWYMGDKQRLYIFKDYECLYLYDLVTGLTYPVLEENPNVEYVSIDGSSLVIEYHSANTGATCFAVLDLFTGQLSFAPGDNRYVTASYLGNDWLCSYYTENNIYHLSVDGEDPVQITENNASLQLLDGNYILKTTEDNAEMILYDLQGNGVSKCLISEREYGLGCIGPIWSDTFEGYFLPISDYSGNRRLLFWDISKRIATEPLLLERIPEPSEQEQVIQERAQELGEKYGLIIMTGNQCDTVFDEFTATIATDYQQVNEALNTLDQALSVYPEGFFRQLRYNNISSIQIQLISDLQAEGSGRYGGDYCAFTQPQWDYYLMVIDIDASDVSTYYHEFSHIIDSYLEWESLEREDALFSEETWNSLNPKWFDGYSYDYGYESYLDDYTYFVDTYATISPTEDRARVLEYAMADFGRWTFEDAKGLQKKLDYYCRCIRDAFDTTGWPEVLPWEQYLS